MTIGHSYFLSTFFITQPAGRHAKLDCECAVIEIVKVHACPFQI